MLGGLAIPITIFWIVAVTNSVNLIDGLDGLAVGGLPFPSQNLVKGDSKSLLIAAASILAKTERDADCMRLEREYPGYAFAKHKGYPTKEHLQALDRLGPCPEHRRSFSPVVEATLFPIV